MKVGSLCDSRCDTGPRSYGSSTSCAKQRRGGRQEVAQAAKSNAKCGRQGQGDGCSTGDLDFFLMSPTVAVPLEDIGKRVTALATHHAVVVSFGWSVLRRQVAWLPRPKSIPTAR